MAPFPSPTSKWHNITYPSISPTRPELSAEGRTVIITGGGTGIGAETARYFAKAGASRIMILGRREQPLLDTKASIERQSPNVEVFVASADVANKIEVDNAFNRFVGPGKVDVLVSNAAVTGPLESVADVDGDNFIDAVDINLRGSLNLAKAFLQHATSSSTVIDISSAAAHVNFGPGFAAYSVAKMGVVRLWDSVAFAYPNLKVFHVQPGIVATAMNQEAGGVEAAGFQDDGDFNVWLASREAEFLSGKFLWSNWDVDELKAKAAEIEGSTQFNIGLEGWPFGQPEWKFQPTASASSAWS